MIPYHPSNLYWCPEAEEWVLCALVAKEKEKQKPKGSVGKVLKDDDVTKSTGESESQTIDPSTGRALVSDA